VEAFGHALSGLALAQAIRPAWRPDETDGRRWLVPGALAALAPDVDAVSWLLGGPEAFHAFHQYYTHSLLVSAVVPPLLGLAVARRLGLPWGRMVGLVWGAWGLHLLGDMIASWPARIFWPFSREGVAFDLLQRDFSIGIPLLLLAGVGASFVDELRPQRRRIAVGTLLAAVAYVLCGPGW